MNKIIVIGSLNMDLVVRATRIPLAGETVAGDGFRIIPGGKGANQAVAVARMGGTVSLIGCVGADLFGRQLIDNLRVQHVDSTHIRIDSNAPTGTATIVVEPSGENRIIVVSGANGKVRQNDIDAAEQSIAEAQLIILQFEIPFSIVEYAIDMAIRHHVPVLLNPAPAYPVSDAYLMKADYLVLNETEARFYSGNDVTDEASARQAATVLLKKGVKVVILTLGEKGAYLATAQDKVYVPTSPVSVVDSTAAGDAFVGGLAISIVEGLELRKAIRVANAAGTLAVTRFGAQTSLPSKQDVQTFLSTSPT